ncbi:MAG TPA: DUF1015 domain-containing protein [Caldisericia bacterium]|nr:DUF1015 domain-containing protein [Caldisericia bacterium]
MADILPFDALMYNTQIVKDLKGVITQPYDKINDKLKKIYIERSEYNAVKLILPDPINEADPDSKYLNAKNILNDWKTKQILKKFGEKAFYYLEQEFTSPITNETIIRKGFVGLMRFTDFSEKIVFPHEKTLSKPKEDRFKLTLTTNTYFEQVFLLFEDNNSYVINAFNKSLSGDSNNFSISVIDDYNVKNNLTPLIDPLVIENICSAFKDKKLVIADGHHRYETGVNYMKYMRERNTNHKGDESYNFGMMYFSPSNQKGLIILPTHRLVHGIASFSLSSFLKNISSTFYVKEFNSIDELKEALTGSKYSFGFYCKENLDRYYLLTLKEDPLNLITDKPLVLRDLDVSILHYMILFKEFGIDEERLAQQINVEYVREIDEGLEEVKSGKEQMMFILNPTPVEQVMKVAINGEVMPQKSTDFYPKLITGLVMYEM